MRSIVLTLMLGALSAAPALAQQAPPNAASPSADMQQHASDERATALASANVALSPDHQSKVSNIINQVKSGQITDARDAAKQIDAILSPGESRAVLAAHDKEIADMRAERGDAGGPGGPAGPGGPGGPGGGGGGGMRPGGAMFGGGRRHPDAGLTLLSLNLDRDQMRALFTQPR